MTTHSIIEADGLKFKVMLSPDYYHEAPWVEEEGHGNVREVNVYRHDFRSYKKPGERVIHVNGYDVWLYDFAGAMKKAKAEGWVSSKATPEMTPGQVRELAVTEDMEHLSAWLRADWYYVMIDVILLDVDGKETEVVESLGGVPSNCEEMIEGEAQAIANNIAERYKGVDSINIYIR